eukprot:GFYU01000578.1.p1 GENE.GFYU01000578.1~~GFYU01000578.1.p1  ORF type:complete len:213 (+),score=47.63 GFYU01000578.1:179-817(+)
MPGPRRSSGASPLHRANMKTRSSPNVKRRTSAKKGKGGKAEKANLMDAMKAGSEKKGWLVLAPNERDNKKSVAVVPSGRTNNKKKGKHGHEEEEPVLRGFPLGVAVIGIPVMALCYAFDLVDIFSQRGTVWCCAMTTVVSLMVMILLQFPEVDAWAKPYIDFLYDLTPSYCVDQLKSAAGGQPDVEESDDQIRMRLEAATTDKRHQPKMLTR